MTYSIAEIARATGLEAAGDLSLRVTGPAEPGGASETDLALAMTPDYEGALRASGARAAVLWPGADWRELGLVAALFAPRPRLALAGFGDLFAPPLDIPPGIHPSAAIAPDARIGEDAWIGPYTSIGPGAHIGAGARILGHCSIGAGARIGPGAILHPGVRIGARVRIGGGFLAHPNAVIGADGFSFVTPEPGAAENARRRGKVDGGSGQPPRRIASLGAVEIGEDVEIGACTAIDRGTVADTCIGSGTKIDNLVQVGHNTRIGASCLICGQAGIAGSVRIGDRVILGGRSAVGDHLRIGDDCVVAGGSLIGSDVPPRTVMMGTIPALRRDAFARQLLALRRLPRLADQIREIRKSLGL